ncbi:MAG: hypothetical protein AB1730_19460 [Myxococcota bacterium]
MTDLRPMRLGELIDRSASFWRGHWRSLFWLAVGFQLAQFILVKTNQLVSSRFLPAMSGELPTLLKDDPATALRQVGVGTALFMVVALATLFVSQVGGVATTFFVYPRLLGREGPTLRAALEQAVRRLGVTLGAFLLSMAWTAVVGLGLVVPGGALAAAGVVLAERGSRAPGAVLLVLGSIALTLGFVALMLWFLIRFLLTAQVVALEDAGPLKVFRRTDALSSGRIAPGVGGVVKLRLMVLITVIGALLVVVSLVASFPSLALGFAYGATLEPGHTVNDVVPQLILVPVELVEVALSSLFAPLYVVFQVFFYVDMRVRREGLDLELKLAA